MADGQLRGEALRGELQFHNLRLLDRKSGTATVEACVGDGLSRYGPGGALVKRSTGINYNLRVMTLVLEEGRWKVAETEGNAQPCEP